jgi:hypothetical protein
MVSQEEMKYGKLLFKGLDLYFKDDKVKNSKASIRYFTIALVCFVIAIAIGFFVHHCCTLIIWTIGIILFLFFLETRFGRTGNFKIYEKGIRFSHRKIPFLYFTDIDSVVERIGRHIGNHYLKILTISGEEYTIGSGFLMNMDETLADYPTASKLIMDNTKAISSRTAKKEQVEPIVAPKAEPIKPKISRHPRKRKIKKVHRQEIDDGMPPRFLKEIK